MGSKRWECKRKDEIFKVETKREGGCKAKRKRWE